MDLQDVRTYFYHVLNFKESVLKLKPGHMYRPAICIVSNRFKQVEVLKNEIVWMVKRAIVEFSMVIF